MSQSAFVLLDVLERISRRVTDLLSMRRSNSGRSIGPQSVIGNTGFCKGPVQSRGAGVRKTIVIYLVDSCDAYDSNGDDPGRPSY